MKALCLLSGGIDSSTALFWAKKKFGHVMALSFDYGQRHSIELKCAGKIAGIAGTEHRILKLNFSMIKSSLTSRKISVPVNRPLDFRGGSLEIPSTWVPQRNTIFLAYAFAIAELENCNAVVAGMNVVDYSGYPDCRPEFLKAFERAGNLASKRFVKEKKRIKIFAPFVKLKKSEIIKVGLALGTPYKYTWSCYSGKIPACGRCDSCRFRLSAFREMGVKDPLTYRK